MVTPSVLVIERSAVGVIASLSVALSLARLESVVPAGAVTLAVLVRVPVALEERVPVAVNVAVPPTARFTVVAMLPLPLAAAQLEPAEAVQVQAIPVRLAGKVSTTDAPVTGLGPAFETVIV